MTIDGLSSLRRAGSHGVGGGLWINGNDSLVTLTGFESLTTVDERVIFNNEALSSAVGFPALSTVNGDLSITYNDVLTAFAFPRLESIGLSLLVTDNYSLCSEDATALAHRVDIGRRTSILRNYGECL